MVTTITTMGNIMVAVTTSESCRMTSPGESRMSGVGSIIGGQIVGEYETKERGMKKG